MRDLVLKCLDCGSEFVWSAGEQAFYLTRGLDQPKYCPICKGKYKAGAKDNFRGTVKKTTA